MPLLGRPQRLADYKCGIPRCSNRATVEVRMPDTTPLVRLCDDCLDNFRSAMVARGADAEELDVRPLRSL